MNNDLEEHQLEAIYQTSDNNQQQIDVFDDMFTSNLGLNIFIAANENDEAFKLAQIDLTHSYQYDICYPTRIPTIIPTTAPSISPSNYPILDTKEPTTALQKSQRLNPLKNQPWNQQNIPQKVLFKS